MPADILLVDDQRDITRFLRHALESLGRGLRIAEMLSAEEALLELRGGRVQVLVTDLRLPGMDGLALLARARKVSPATRAVVISGQADGDQRRAAEQLGAEAILDKPIELSEFLATVTRLLETSRPAASEVTAEPHQVGATSAVHPGQAPVPGEPITPPRAPSAVGGSRALGPEHALQALCVALGATGAWAVTATGDVRASAGERVAAVLEQSAALIEIVQTARLALEALRQPAGEHWHELASSHGALWLTELAPDLILIALAPIGAERRRDHASLDAVRSDLLAALTGGTDTAPPTPSTTLAVTAIGTAELRALDDALADLDSQTAESFWDA